MATALFSASWYRVAALKPRLRKHVEIHRHDYRSRIWFVLQDHASGRSHRLSPAAYHFIGLMNGERSVQKLWDLANEQLADRTPTQDETIRLLGQLHAADAMICDATPDSRELFRRHQRQERMKVKQKIWSPLAVRLPLWDPDNFLTRTLPYVRHLFHRPVFVLWFAVIASGLSLAVMNFGAITENIFDRALTPANLLVLWLVYPVVKAFHELGHGYAVKVKGGEVHEIGIMFLVLIPVPYVDASAASSFRDKHERMLVGGIGIMVELALATLALVVWLNAEKGPVHVLAYNVMLIGGVSTLLLTAIRYFDLMATTCSPTGLKFPISGPGLTGISVTSCRSTLSVRVMSKRLLTSRGNGSGLCSTALPRLSIASSSCLRSFFISVASFSLSVSCLPPGQLSHRLSSRSARGVSFLMTSNKLKSNRPRAVMTTLGFLTLAGLILFVMPFPHRTIVDGVTWPPDRSQIRARSEGFIVDIPIKSRTRILEGDPILVTSDPFLKSRVELLTAHIRALELQRSALSRQDRVEEQ